MSADQDGRRSVHVTALNIYPVKSTGGLSAGFATVEPWGLAGDRRWAVVDERGQKVTARTHPTLLCVTATPTPSGGLVLVAPGMNPLAIRAPETGEEVEVDFSHLDRAILAGPDAGAWLTRVLHDRVRLVWLDDPGRRTVAASHGGRFGDTVNLADSGPLLLTSLASLRRLNEWITATASDHGELSPTLSMARFRPNVVVIGSPPFAEDHWTGVRIGEVDFRVSEACDRCVMTTIEPTTLHRGKEPLRTLAKHRRDAGKVWFGIKLVPEARGEIRVGDPVMTTTAR